MSISINFIYVLELENGKFYIGISNNKCLIYNIKTHFGYNTPSFSRENRPIGIFDLFYSRNIHTFKIIMIEYMLKYGANNVHGGIGSIDTYSEHNVDIETYDDLKILDCMGKDIRDTYVNQTKDDEYYVEVIEGVNGNYFVTIKRDYKPDWIDNVLCIHVCIKMSMKNIFIFTMILMAKHGIDKVRSDFIPNDISSKDVVRYSEYIKYIQNPRMYICEVALIIDAIDEFNRVESERLNRNRRLIGNK